MNVSEILFALLRSEICEEQVCDELKNSISPETLPALYKISKAHDLSHLIADALDKNGLLPTGSEAEKRFLQQRNMAVYRYEQFHYELEEICTVLSRAEIKHIPLKGSVIREHYPQPWMRTSCDIDILVHKEDLEKAIAALESELKYKHEYGCAHDESLYSESGVHLELHHTLLEDVHNEKASEILGNVWGTATPKAGQDYVFELTNEMFYFYHIAHMAKHFEHGGCGIKPFLDILVIENNIPLDEAKRDELLDKGGLLKFSDNARKLANVWFADVEYDKVTSRMEEYVLKGGVYGTLENRVVAQQAKKGGKFRYAMSRIFLPYENLKYSYPIIRKHRWLTPFYEVVRWFRILFKGSAKKSVQEFSANAAVSDETRERTAELLNELGLSE